MDGYCLPILYTSDKNGKIRVWRTWVVGKTVYRTSGLKDGKQIHWERTFEGKNIGKVNETSPEEQAILEAERTWTKQLDKKYKPECEEGMKLYNKVMKSKEKSSGHNINASSQIRGGKGKNVKRQTSLATDKVNVNIIPMKAQTWEVHEGTTTPLDKVIKYFDFDKGVYIQWKLDGFRCVVRLQNNDIVLTTNAGKQYPWFKSLREELKRFIKGKDYLDGLDGEIYNHTLVNENGKEYNQEQRFSMIQGISSISRTEPHQLEDQICFYVFDLVDLSGKYTQKERFDKLNKLFKGFKSDRIIMTKTEIINKPLEIVKKHDQYANEGYEGIIIRSLDLKYKVKYRSLSMRKYKYFIDEEYVIVDVTKDKGVAKEYFVWVCMNDKGKKFKAKPMGTSEEREYWYDNHKKFIGKLLTVKFQEYTEEGVPRFPVAKGFRELEDMSTPLVETC